MDCRTFHQHHLAFVDDTLPGADRELMELHRRECANCQRQDSLVRRGIFLVRNIPLIEPSPDFADRLETRLKGVKQDRRPVLVKWERRFGNAFTVGTVAIGLAACALLALGVAQWAELAPVTAASSVGVEGFGGGDDARSRDAAVPGGVPAAAAAGFVSDNAAPYSAQGDPTTTMSGATAPHGYTLEMHIEPSFVNYDGALLMQELEFGIDPALVTSASAGLSLWPGLMLNDDLPRVFRESGFSLADLSQQ